MSRRRSLSGILCDVLGSQTVCKAFIPSETPTDRRPPILQAQSRLTGEMVLRVGSPELQPPLNAFHLGTILHSSIVKALKVSAGPKELPNGGSQK